MIEIDALQFGSMQAIHTAAITEAAFGSHDQRLWLAPHSRRGRPGLSHCDGQPPAESLAGAGRRRPVGEVPGP